MYLIMCCNVVQTAVKCMIAPRKSTVQLCAGKGLKIKEEFIFYLKSCSVCGGSRITVFAVDTLGVSYFITRIKSKNIKSFLENNPVIKVVKGNQFIKRTSKNLPLCYYDKGKKFKCLVNYSSLKLAPFDSDVLKGLRREV